MITVAVPNQAVADALGDLGGLARVVVWDPAGGDAPAAEAAGIDLVCLEHYTGGRVVYERIAACGGVRLVQLPSAGFEHALPFVPQGVWLANAQGVHDARVAEGALALVLASWRLLPEFFDAQRRRVWEPRYFNPSLADARALVVGYGSIGAAIGTRLRACEVHVEGVARTARTAADGTTVHAVADLHAAMRDAQIVVVVTPLDPSTERLIDAEALAQLPDGALVVNVGRGRVIDTEALLAELRAGRLRAALDVTDPEPLPSDHPLWEAPGCIVLPHVTGGEPLTNRRFTALVRTQIERLAAGEQGVNIVAVG